MEYPRVLDDYHWYASEGPPMIETRRVPVMYKGLLVPELYADIGCFVKGRAFCFADSIYNLGLHQRATTILRRIGQILPVEYVGNPDCSSGDLCVLIEKYAEVDLKPRKRMLLSISEGAKTMQEKKAITTWAESTGLPEDCEWTIKQFLLPVQYSRTLAKKMI
jgi:hypothetical protein